MRLIDADVLTSKLKTTFCEECNNGIRCVACAISDVLSDIKNSPAVDTVKHGHWVKVGGYFTPGGDPLWKCSECGKGLHLYGVEHGSYGSDVADSQWVACPNCGAKMDEVSE